MNYSEKVIQNNFNAIYSYASLKDFYENGVGSSQYEYNIITPRKAMGLNKIFFDPCENMTQNCIQATTKSFVLYIEEICKKIENGDAKEHSFISIVDDILLVFLTEQTGRIRHRTPFPPSATPAGITHYTLQAKSCAKEGPPLETPDNKTGGMLPSPGAYRRLLSAARFTVCV